MTLTRQQRLTFLDYLELDDDREGRCELIDGELITVPPESGTNTDLAHFLFLQFVNAGIPFQQVKLHSCELQVPVLQPGDAANRYPDLVLLRPEHIALTRTRLTIFCDALPPYLVVEIVSPGSRNRERDYTRKRAQYAARGIPEYWVADPGNATLLILQLDGTYSEVGRFSGETPLRSPQLERLGTDLRLSAAQLFAAIA